MTRDEVLLEVREALKNVVDPELGINVVDLGLVAGLALEADGTLLLSYRLTSPGCPVGGMIADGMWQASQAVPGVTGVQMELSEDGWNPSMMSPQARNLLP